MTPILESLVHVTVVVVAYIHFRNKPWVLHADRKIVKDHRLGKLGMRSIRCGSRGVTCSCKEQDDR